MTYIKQEEIDKTFRGNKTTKTDRNDRAELIKKGFSFLLVAKIILNMILKKKKKQNMMELTVKPVTCQK